MEEEEFEVRKLIFEKNFKLISGEHIQIEIDQFNQMEREFRAFLRDKLSKEMVGEFKEFMQQVHLCLKLINKCPDKDLLENEVREKVDELIP